MPYPRTVNHFTFEGGEADAQYARRPDNQVWIATCKRARDVLIKKGGGFTRRPGLARVLALSGASRLARFTSREGVTRNLIFYDDAVAVLDGESLEATITGCIWATADLATMQIAYANDKVIITSHAFFPQVMEWDGSAFTVGDMVFRDLDGTGATAQPYYRFDDTRGTILTPNATTGTDVAIASDGPVWAAGHVGYDFQITGRALRIDQVTDADTARFDTLQALYPTVDITVTSTNGFAVGDPVTTKVDSIQGEVVSIPDATSLFVLLTNGFTYPSTTSNEITGPTANTALSAVVLAATHYGTSSWFESMINPVRGYPGGCGFHKKRLVLFDFPQAPEQHAFSQVGIIDDFDYADGEDTDAMVEGPGDALGRRVRHCLSSEQLLTFTEAGSYYIGEGPNTPLTPTNVEFLRIGPEAIGACNPVLASEGAIFIDEFERLLFLAPTGQLRRVWGASEMSTFAYDLITNPVRMILVDGCDWGPERFVLIVNGDGTACVVHYPRGESNVYGGSLWAVNDGLITDAMVWGDSVYAVIDYSARGLGFVLHRFDVDRLLDGSALISTTASQPTYLTYASKTCALVWRKTVSTEERRSDTGLFAANGSGVFTGVVANTRSYEVGFRFAPYVTLFPPISAELGVGEFQRTSEVSVDILTSGRFYAQGKVYDPYRAADDLSEPPPLRSGWRRKKLLSRKRDLEYTLSQVEAAPWHVRALTMETA
jgi:hypothetical protein